MAKKVIEINKVAEKKAKNETETTIRKIKFDVDTWIPKINYVNANIQSDKEIICKGKKEALDEFVFAMQALKDFFLETCEIENKKDDTIITQVSFSEKGVIITAKIYLRNKEIDPLNINTPLLRYVKNGGSYELEDEILNLLDELKRAANDYISGKTKFVQTTMKFGT